MLINIEKLKQENKSFYELKTEIELSQLDIKDMAVLIPVKVDFKVQILGEEVLVKGRYSTRVEYQCVRCLENFQADFEGGFETLFYSENSNEENEEESYEEDIFREPLQNGKIDMVEFIRENMILEMEQYPVCSKECKGLENFEEYDNKGIDPRWQQLINIIKDNK